MHDIIVIKVYNNYNNFLSLLIGPFFDSIIMGACCCCIRNTYRQNRNYTQFGTLTIEEPDHYNKYTQFRTRTTEKHDHYYIE